MVADCEVGTGVARVVATGEITSGPGVANVACGINTNRKVKSASWMGIVPTAFGDADKVRFVDDELIRTYLVGKNGVILDTVFAKNAPGEPVELRVEPVGLTSVLPAGDLFSEASLSASYVPEDFKRRPRSSRANRAVP